MSATETSDDKLVKRVQMKDCCRKVLKFLFSHIGLCGMVVAYSIAGGFIFEHLEQMNELTECVKARDKYVPVENDTKSSLLTIAYSGSDFEYVLTQFEDVLRKYRKNVLELGYDGKDCARMGKEGGPGFQWSFARALHFSVTVITTIGYGNIAPKTYWGRLVCIAYAVLGIPLMLLCLANIGDVMADIFRFVYSNVCCCGCCRRRGKESTKGEPLPPKVQGHKPPDAWKTASPPQRSGPDVLDDEDDDDEEENDKISIPLTITMVVITGYILMGALLFGLWEKWAVLHASYFCFVTLSTIGFGDVVPGAARFENAEDQYKMVLSAIYMIFGMAILSMCFSLMQEEMVAKFKWVGEKIGIIEKEQIEDDDVKEEAVITQKTQPLGKQVPKQVTPGVVSEHGAKLKSSRTTLSAAGMKTTTTAGNKITPGKYESAHGKIRQMEPSSGRANFQKDVAKL